MKPGKSFNENKLRAILTMFLCTTLFYSVFAQNKEGKICKNDVEVNFSSLVMQFTKRNNVYAPPMYHIAYRRWFKQFNIRLGIGGSYYEYKPGDGSFEQSRYEYNAKVGIERECLLFKKLKFYYGLDFLGTKYESKIKDFDNTNWVFITPQGICMTQTIQQTKTNGLIYGAGPLFGLRYAPVERILISVETNYALFFSKQKYTSKYIYTNPQITSPEDTKSENKTIYTAYTFPTAIRLAFKF